jgi:hypothetical protein
VFCFALARLLKIYKLVVCDLGFVVRQELKVFSDEVIRFGNRSKDPQWHNLDRYFEK